MIDLHIVGWWISGALFGAAVATFIGGLYRRRA